MKAWKLLGVLSLVAMLAGCPKPDPGPAVPAQSASTPAPAAETPPPAEAAPVVEAPPANAPAPGTALPPPSIAIGEPNPGAPSVVDTSCKTDADCAIKDVGSCCGARPACVNTASPTFPDKVKAECASSGRMGICGFPAITGCKCNAGQCEGTGSGAGEKVQ